MAASLAALRRRRHRGRRRLPDRLHLRHHRRAEGHDALPPRRAGDLRHLRRARAAGPSRTTSSSARRRSPSPSGSAGSCSSRCASAPRPCCSSRPRRTSCSRRSQQLPRHRLLHRADRLPRDARQARRARRLVSLRKCVSAGETLPEATFDAWQDATGLKIIDGIGATEMLHIFIAAPRGRDPPRRHRQAGARLRGAGRRRRTAATCRRAPSAASRCAARPAAATSPTSGSANYVAGRLEPHRRHLPAWMRTATSGTRRAPTT